MAAPSRWLRMGDALRGLAVVAATGEERDGEGDDLKCEDDDEGEGEGKLPVGDADGTSWSPRPLPEC